METRSIDDTSGYLQFEIPMVSSDGQPHKVLTMVAVGSGLGAAIVVLLILVALIARQRQRHPGHHPGNGERLLAKQERSKSLFSLFSKRASLDITILDANYLQRVAATAATAVATQQPEQSQTPLPPSTPTMMVAELECIDETQLRRSDEPMAMASNNNTTEMLPRIEEKLRFGADAKLAGISTISC